MSWETVAQICVIVIVVGAIVDVWITDLKRVPKPPRGYGYVDPQGGKR